MNTKILYWLGCLFLAFTVASCSGDDEVDENSIENNLSDDAKIFVGYWENMGNKGYNYFFFEDGYSWSQVREGKGHYDSGYWAFDPSTKLLSTTTSGNWQWQVTLSNSEAWTGVSIGTSTPQTFKKVDTKYNYVRDLLLNSTWEESADSTLYFRYNSEYISLEGTINAGGPRIQIEEDDNTDDYIVSYEIGTYVSNGNKKTYWKKNGSGTIELLHPTYLSKNQLRITGYLNKTLKRKMEESN
jgi:hypothetical protein